MFAFRQYDEPFRIVGVEPLSLRLGFLAFYHLIFPL